MPKIITISREFGSGGREIGKRLSEELDFAYYDQEIIKEICKQTGMNENFVNEVSERAITLVANQFGHTFYNQQQIDILVSQQKIIQELAKKGDCVIVGHGCAEILADQHPFSIFVYASMEAKVKRCRLKGPEEEKLTDKELVRKIKDVDKNRKWGEKENYDLCLNTTHIQIKEVIPGLAKYIQECL
ncbi:AAA family ATPase [Dubosiella newyorkensis]|uniref:cytidylate kinase-like family protein n=1 Tax=Dubosiella newyorkensis TaxID=1862672 RepID=UPI0027307A31|nr:cytidylate kinase-like family protein [Dubosiella newyorkensis]